MVTVLDDERRASAMNTLGRFHRATSPVQLAACQRAIHGDMLLGACNRVVA